MKLSTIFVLTITEQFGSPKTIFFFGWIMLTKEELKGTVSRDFLCTFFSSNSSCKSQQRSPKVILNFYAPLQSYLSFYVGDSPGYPTLPSLDSTVYPKPPSSDSVVYPTSQSHLFYIESDSAVYPTPWSLDLVVLDTPWSLLTGFFTQKPFLIGLKGQCHEIFYLCFFHQTILLGPLSGSLEGFRFYFRIRGEIRIKKFEKVVPRCGIQRGKKKFSY